MRISPGKRPMEKPKRSTSQIKPPTAARLKPRITNNRAMGATDMLQQFWLLAAGRFQAKVFVGRRSGYPALRGTFQET